MERQVSHVIVRREFCPDVSDIDREERVFNQECVDGFVDEIVLSGREEVGRVCGRREVQDWVLFREKSCDSYLVGWTCDVDGLCEAARDREVFDAMEHVFLEVLVGGEDLAGVARDDTVGVPAEDGGLLVPVSEVDDHLSGPEVEVHIVEDDAVMGGGVEVPELVHVSDHEWVFK